MKTSVSGCYQSNGSKATVSVEVAWSNAPSGDNIVVTYGAQSRTIIPGPYTTSGGNGTIVSPQVVAFEVDANGATGQLVTANFVTNTGCSATSTAFSLPSACLPLSCTGNELGGTVFYDYNADGKKDAGESLGLPAVTVKAFDCDGNLVGTTTTDAYGKYVFATVAAANYPLRVEFSNLPALYGQGTMNGADGRTTTQFINAPDCNVDLGVLNPVDYCESNPMLSIPCYVYGDPLPAGSVSGTRDAVVGFDYNLSGLTNMAAMTHIATASQVGTVWGEAYNKKTQKLFMSTTLKRHSGLGPLGLGGIYVTDWSDPLNPITTPWLSVTSLTVSGVPIDVGSIPVNGAGGRGLSTDPTQPSRDSIAFTQAAKIGIGGLALSEDGNTLFFTNLFDAKLYKVDMTTYNASGTNPTTATSIDVFGSTSCPGGTIRPWATKFYKGDVYVGAVCDAQTSGSKSDLRAFVYKVNPTTGTSTMVFDFPLTYPKGFANTDGLSATGWYPWSDLWAGRFITANNEVVHPQPIFQDIEFDIDGTMILGFGDRNGVQTGYRNYMPTGTSTALYSGHVSGDILRAFYNQSGAYVLENNAKAGPNIGYGPNNNQGPGFGEYYNDNFQDKNNGNIFHAEIVMGGLAVRPGSGEVLAITIDPLDVPSGTSFYAPYLQAGGVRHFNNQTGQTTSAYIVYSSNLMPGLFGKSTGLGDIVLRCSLPQFIEIGNRVWVDTNKNGVQDPCEKALPGVTVSLYKGAALIATTTTNANGEYYFSSKSKLTTGTWSGTGADTTLLPTTQYSLVFGQSGNQYSAGTLTVSGNGKFVITTKDATVNNGNDQNDSDIAEVNGFPTISVTTGDLASVNHTFDAGFYCVFPASSNIQVALPSCPSVIGTNTTDGKIQITAAVEFADRFRVRAGTNWIGAADTTYATAALIGSTFPKDVQTGISSAGGSYIIRLYNGECCYRDTIITIQPRTKPNAGANQSICAPTTTATLTAITAGGTWTAQAGNPAAATVTSAGAVSGMSANGTYKFIYTLNGCTDTVSVIRNPKPDAGANQNICAPATTATLTAITAGGTWTAQAGNPAAATVTSAGAVSGMTANGTYNFIYTLNGCTDTVSVVRNPKPDAGANQNICAPATTATLTAITAGGTWTAQAGNPAAATVTSAGAVSGMSANGTYKFIYTLNGCTDTVSVIRNPKPDAGANQNICAPATTATLTAITAGGTWTAQAGNPAAATVTSAGAVSGMSANGTYKFIYTLNGCTDTVSVIRNPQPIQVNLSPAVICENQSLTYTDASGTNGTWSGPGVSDTGTGATVSGAAALTQLGQSAPTSFYIYYTQILGECSRTDSGLVSINPRPLVSITGPTLVCGNELPVSFTGSPAGGTFTLPQGLPVGAVTISNNVATLNAGFNIASLTFSYQFTDATTGCSNTDSHSITVTPAPNAGPDQTLACVNPVTNTLQTTTTLTGAPSGGTWSAQSGNPASAMVTNAGVVTGMSMAGTYQFIYTLNDCSDTVSVTVSPCQGCVKPNAGNDQSICSPTTTATLTAITSGGTWSAQSGNPVSATITNAGAVAGMTVDGTYRFIYSVTSGGETCTDTVSVVRNPKPDAGANQNICAPATTATLTAITAGGTWTAQAGNPAAATVTSAGAVSGMSANGTYKFIYTLNGCTDTVSVIRNPKPDAGANQNICAPATTATLTAITAGGTWTAQAGNPAAATVTSAGAVSGMSANGTYNFIYTLNGCTDTVSVVRNPKPNAGANQNICAPATTVTLTAITAGGTWTAQAGNPAAATVTSAGAVSGMTANGTYNFVYTLNGCTDTVSVVRNPKPDAGANQNICAPATTATLTAITAGGTWTAQAGNPAAATVTSAGAVSGMSANGTYNFIYTLNGCTDTVSVVRNLKPDAGVDQTLTCPPSGISPTTATLSGAPSGGVWSTLASNPAAATVTNAGAVSGMTVAGTYQFIYTLNNCADTVQIEVPTCIVPVFDLALRKTLATGQSASVVAGSNVTFTITVFNQGNVDATNIQVTDYIPTGLTLNDANWTATAGVATLNTVIASLPAGQSTTRDITFVVSTGFTGSISNLAEISSATGGTDVDSSPDSNPANDGTPKNDVINENGLTGGDEDDHDPEVITVTPAPVFDLALRKTLATGQSASVVAGSNVTFTITVFNQGNVDATNIQVTDYIPTGLTLNDANWTATAGVATLNTVIASLPAGQSTTRDITFVVSTGFTGSISNLAEISSATGGTDVDSSPDSNPANDGTPKNDVINENGLTGGDEDDHDPEVITVTPAPVFDLALRKTLATGQSASVVAGSNVTFTITVFNQGNVDATNIQVTDYIPTGLTLNDANWTATAGVATLNTVIASLPAGQSTTRDITFVVSTGFTGSISNLAEISSATGGTDVDSSPDSNPANDGTPKNDVINENGLTGGDEDDHDPEVITVTPAPVFDLALRKTLATGQSASVVAGSNVTFTITVFNQGNVDATNIQVTDYIPTGLTLNDANWTATAGVATLNTVIASLPAGQSTTRDITFVVSTGFTGSISNLAEISSATGGTDVDSSPDNNPANDGTPKNDVINENGLTGGDEDDHDPEVITVTPPAQVDLSLKKLINTKIAQLGDTLTYTIKVFNQSATLATGVEVTDSLATSVQFINGSFTSTRGTAAITNNVIIWNIGNIAASGDTVTLTYKVKAIQEGVHFNTAEISKTNESDVDSTPGNGVGNEDDIDRQCFTVPLKLCVGEKIELSVPSYLVNVQWYKDSGTTPVASGNVVLFSEAGSYTFTASNQQCPATGCCPIIIEPGDNCCPVDLCIPFTIKQTKKGEKPL
ncbi:SdrD B-like domain-containing protein [Runella rosea]|uniref:SdrD B-like domain-containing protein n=1 Tax=Runella rosea TaxID=2259595 RepID=UPI0013B40FB6|nr:SdrD B-like domain-containing protein [Runella rosea]